MHTACAHPRIAIIGSGFGGICMGIQLKQAGIDSFTIFEKAARLGGTWRDNTYPGAACDSPSFVYCFSFEQKTDWSRKWAPQAEILEYIEHCARKYDVLPHIRFDTEIAGARFDAERGIWCIRTTGGEEIEAEVLVSGTGQLNRPYAPELPGLERFTGASFHSARWDHGVDLAGKNVAVIGNAASAIQFVPRIAPVVKRLSIFQRSANWMMAKNDRAYGEVDTWLLSNVPLAARLYRWWLWAGFEMRFPVFRQNALLSRIVGNMAERNMREHVSDPVLRKALVPDFPVGGKRILISDDYYQALGLDNVEVLTSPIDQVRENAILTQDGRTVAADVIILATGFHSTMFLAPMRIEGLDHRSLDDVWSDGAEAYLGITVSGFPNFFMLYGPNTNLGHNSIIFMLECQVRYIVYCIETLESRNLKYIDVRPDVMRTYNDWLRSVLATSVWAATGKSWYKRADGKITNNWSGSTIQYWWNTLWPDLDAFHKEARGTETEEAVANVA